MITWDVFPPESSGIALRYRLATERMSRKRSDHQLDYCQLLCEQAYPDIIGPEYIYKGLNYIFGCHPYSNPSFVSSVGTRSKRITYGSNKADFRFIAGGVVPGIMILKPDFPENKEDWPFLWEGNECVVVICAAYIFLSNTVNDLAN
jgi:endoglucanase